MTIAKVFVSSTCFDLRQIRVDIKEAIEGLGHNPILSEYHTFPIDPNTSTLENCTKAIENHADIFVLIVGGRYGSIADDGKSITNIEYLRARSKGIPVYIFVRKDILTTIKLWKDNPLGNFASVVDSTKVFEFVDEIRSINQKWVFDFETAQNIIETLRVQFATLFLDCLNIRKRLNVQEDDSLIRELSGESLRLVLEKPIAWEYRLFCEELSKGINSLSCLRRDLKYGISVGYSQNYETVSDTLDWVRSQLPVLRGFATSADVLMNQAFQVAVGEPGQEGDPSHIVYVAKKIIEIYETCLKWTIQVKSTNVPERCEALMNHFGRFCEGFITEFERLNIEMRNGIGKALHDLATSGEPVTMELSLIFNLPGADEFHKELKSFEGEIW